MYQTLSLLEEELKELGGVFNDPIFIYPGSSMKFFDGAQFNIDQKVNETFSKIAIKMLAVKIIEFSKTITCRELILPQVSEYSAKCIKNKLLVRHTVTFFPATDRLIQRLDILVSK